MTIKVTIAVNALPGQAIFFGGQEEEKFTCPIGQVER